MFSLVDCQFLCMVSILCSIFQKIEPWEKPMCHFVRISRKMEIIGQTLAFLFSMTKGVRRVDPTTHTAQFTFSNSFVQWMNNKMLPQILVKVSLPSNLRNSAVDAFDEEVWPYQKYENDWGQEIATLDSMACRNSGRACFSTNAWMLRLCCQACCCMKGDSLECLFSFSKVPSAMSWDEATQETISFAGVSYPCVLDKKFAMCVPDAFCVL